MSVVNNECCDNCFYMTPCMTCFNGNHFKRDKPKESDTVNHPAHYNKGEVECLEALKAATINLSGIEAVCTANAIKYLWRWKDKGGVEDLKKAIFYTERLIKETGDPT